VNDRRLTPCNGNVAETGWEGRVSARRFSPGQWQAVFAPVTDLCAAPGGARDRQLLKGDRFLTLDRDGDHAFGRAEKDGYVGWVPVSALGCDHAASHAVSVRSSHEYAAADVKARDLAALSFGARLSIVGEAGGYLETAEGRFVPAAHLRPLDRPLQDPVAVAELFLGTPYLWGGNSAWGIDCSGLVQAAMLATGRECPGDSDLQQRLGQALSEDAPPARGDLWFWDGHVGILRDARTLLHANAHHMAVVSEPLDEALGRMAAQEVGPVIARRRL